MIPVPSAPKKVGDSAANVVSDTVQQRYSNSCAVKSQQLILERFGIHVSEEELCRIAESNGWFGYDDPNTPQIEGGTPMMDVGKLLEHFGIPIARFQECNVFNLFSELSKGHQVIVGIDSKELWEQKGIFEKVIGPRADHALIVSGIDASNPADVKIIITDPGTGDFCKEYSLAQFMKSYRGSNYFMVTTQIPTPHVFDAYNDVSMEHLPFVGELSFNEFQEQFALPLSDETAAVDINAFFYDFFNSAFPGLETSEENLVENTDNPLLGESYTPSDENE